MEKSKLIRYYIEKYTKGIPSEDDIANAYRDAVLIDGEFELTIEDFLQEYGLDYNKERILKKVYEKFEWRFE